MVPISATETEQQGGAELQCIGDAKREAGMTQLQDQPVLDGDLYPGADVRHDLRNEIPAEIAMA
jgi:hypothetical protein